MAADHCHLNKPAEAKLSYGVKTYCFERSSLRQFNPEAASASDVASHSNRSRHALDCPPHDCQSDPSSLEGAVNMCALVQIKNLRLGARLDADAIVFKPKPHVVAHRLGADA